MGGAPETLGGEGGEQQPAAASDFQRILERFGTVEGLLGSEEGEGGAPGSDEEGKDKDEGAAEGKDGGDDNDSDGEEAGLSRKKRKLASRLKIAELKQACDRPEVVEVWDVTAQDPKLLVYLKVRACVTGTGKQRMCRPCGAAPPWLPLGAW